MKFKKVLYYDYRQSDDELLPPFLISYVKKGIHGLVAISCKVGDSYYILYSLGLFVTGSDTSSASVSGPLGKRNAKVFFDEISRSQASPDVQAVHYASTKTRACELYTKMLEIERSQQVMKWFRMMNLNCHNFASFVMVAGGIVDDQFLGGIIAVKGNSYSLERVKLSSLDKGAEQKFFLKLRDKSNDQYIYQQKTKQCFINLNNCTCCRYRYGGQGLSIFKWPAGITIQDSCSHSPAKSLFEDVDTAEKHYFSGEKFRLRQAKALLKAYAGSNFWGKKNYVGDISNLVMQRMSWSATSNSFNYISELLSELETIVLNKDFHPNMGGSLIGIFAFIHFFLDKNYGKINETLSDYEINKMKKLDAVIECNFRPHRTVHKPVNESLHKAYVTNYGFEPKNKAFKGFRKFTI